MLVMSPTVHAAMVAHAVRGLPHEACGLFTAGAGPTSDRTDVVGFHPMTNTARSSQIYTLDGQEMLDVETTADAEGRVVVGVMHSHTHTTAYPSPTDVADASAFDPFGAWHYVIVSLRDAVPALRSYRIIDGEIAEERVVIEQAV